MKTILKVPLYLELDCENIDRQKVSSFSKKVIIPYIQDSFLRKFETFPYVLKDQISKELGEFQLRVFHEIEFFQNEGTSSLIPLPKSRKRT